MSGHAAVAHASNPMGRENDYYDEEPGEEMDPGEDDLTRFLDEIRTAKNCVKCFNVVLLLLGIGLTVFSFVGGELLLSLNWLAYAMSGLGISIVFVTLLGLMGACFDMFNRLLVIVSGVLSPLSPLVSPPSQYYTLLVFLTLFLTVMGGFCFVLTDTAIKAVRASFETLLLELDPARRNTLTLEGVITDLRLYLFISGGAAWFIAILLLFVMSNVVKLVTPAKAYGVLLQATNLAILPLGIALISAGLYVGDTAATIEAPFAAFAVFLMGFLVIFFAIVGCAGTTIDSRGIIRLYTFLIGILGVLFLAFGIASLAVADTVQQLLLERWNSIRKVLPPTFSGKYDRGQFEAFVETNLKAVGFMSLCAGIVLYVQLFAAMRLRGELKRMNDAEDRVDKLFDDLTTVVKDLQQAEVDHRACRKALLTSGKAPSAVQVLAAKILEECQIEYDERAADVQAVAEVEELSEEEILAELEKPPRRRAGEGKDISALREAEYRRVLLQARKETVEEEIHLIDAARIEDQGASGAKEAAKRMSIKPSKSGGVAMPVEDRFKVPERRERNLNAGALFWKRWWTKGTRGSRCAVKCVCCLIFGLIVLILGIASMTLYFSTSCASLAGASLDKSYTDFGSSVWFESAVRRGTASLLPVEGIASSRAKIVKTAFQQGMLSPEFPTAQAHDGGTKEGIGLRVAEPTPTKVLSFDISCQTADGRFEIPQKGASTSTTARRLESLAVSERAVHARDVLLSRVNLGSRQLATTTTTQIKNTNNAFLAGQGSSTLTTASPGAWVSLDLVNATAAAVEVAARESQLTFQPPTVAPLGSPEADFELTGALAVVAFDWSSVAWEARPYLRKATFKSQASTDLTGVMLGGQGVTATTNLGDVTVESSSLVCDEALLGTGTGGANLVTSKGTVLIRNSIVYNCDTYLAGQTSLVRIENSIFLNEKGGSSVTLRGEQGSLQADHVNVEKLIMEGTEGSARVESSEIRESLKISTTTGDVYINELVAGSRAVIQVETTDGNILINANRFRGIVSVVTSGSVTCAGAGFQSATECKASQSSANGLTFVEEARVNCSDDCAYLGELTIVSSSGHVTLSFAKVTA
jgi:hypothetical protein